MFKSLKIYNLLFLRLIFILVGVELAILFFKKDLIFTTIFSLFIVFLLIRELYFYVRNFVLLYNKTIASILEDDFSSDFSKHKFNKNYDDLFTLYNTLKTKQKEEVSKDIVYRSILNNIETGIFILQKEGDDWNVFLMNDYFSKYFDVPKISKWKYLKNHLPALCNVIEEQDFQEIKTAIDIRVNQENVQTFVMQTSRTEICDLDYFIVLLDSIQNVVEKKEKEAWVNLMKVISHELLNSITPIRSISQNLQELVEQDSISSDDIEDIKSGVGTMLRRSDLLQKFVEGYRKLAMLPSPQKDKIDLLQLIADCLLVMDPLFKERGIEVINTIDFKYWLSVDQQQMEQVLINLLTNSMHALENSENKQILIASEIKENRIFIKIIDNGTGIDKEIETKVFLPFFTTRQEGAGIGLTLSKSIIEAHGGYLDFKNQEDKTTFVICLVEN
ncbi:HAMP domain-containing sensor histidine kinase [Flavobacterium branchiarum]|uniref:histidine kinase n=1 Tax=Flavobacterium branchiarum TaxID=1114870 RepID=A0ABV5FH87_9FLAO|nr:HAMP domain-containing sensor histidine kinase [Flavobacterium branchiarum]MDN3671787.1 HAMP domain-containing sensor histidine kinase [Flavobacterium branchiarum]